MIELLWPVPDTSERIVTSPYGRRIHPVTGIESIHSGIDIRAAQGSIIVAPMDGVVTSLFSDDRYGGGSTLILKGMVGRHYVQCGFCHLSASLRSKDSSVRKGDYLCLSGGTPGTAGAGRSTGPHLHLSMRLDGVRIDPMDVRIRWLDSASDPSWSVGKP